MASKEELIKAIKESDELSELIHHTTPPDSLLVDGKFTNEVLNEWNARRSAVTYGIYKKSQPLRLELMELMEKELKNG